ncbi:MAG: hypothetical protein WCA82_08980 [Jiangellales bacterium]
MLLLDPTDLRRLLERIGEQPVLTLHLPVDPSDAENQREPGTKKWEVRLRNQLADLEAEVPALADDRPARRRWETIRERAEQWLVDYAPAGRTLVLFVDEDEAIDIELPVVLEQSAGYGHPEVGGLVRAMSENRYYLTVLVDQQSARAAEGYLGFVGDVAHLELSDAWGMPGTTRSGHQFRFEARREEYQERFHADVADQIDRYLVDNADVERLVLGGIATEAHGVARALSQRSHRALMGVVPMPVTSSPDEISERIDPHAQAYENEQDQALVAALGSARAAGRAADGPEATQGALDQYLAQEVLVSGHLDDSDLLEALSRAAVLSGVDVHLLHGSAADALDDLGGVAARLYYAVPEQTLAAAESPAGT